jgi:hypothetical protein
MSKIDIQQFAQLHTPYKLDRPVLKAGCSGL